MDLSDALMKKQKPKEQQQQKVHQYFLRRQYENLEKNPILKDSMPIISIFQLLNKNSC